MAEPIDRGSLDKIRALDLLLREERPGLWRRFSASPWLLPLPALGLQLLGLALHPGAWSEAVDRFSRSGAVVGRTTRGIALLELSGVLLLVVWATCLPIFRVLLAAPRIGMTAPSETERGCAVSLIRWTALLALYALALAGLFGGGPAARG